jgi:outer membrane receptor for ferrienterochelin and colicin
VQYLTQQLDGSLAASAAPSSTAATGTGTIQIPQTTANIVGAYLGAKWDMFDDFQVLPGIRFEHFSQTGETIGDPRVVVRWRLFKDQPGIADLSLKAAAGEYHQPPSLLQSAAQIGNPSLDSENSSQYLGGIEYRPNKKLLIDVSGFYVDLSNVIVSSTVVTRVAGAAPVPQVFSNGGSGETRGLELFVQQQLWRDLEGWLYYTFSVSDLSTGAGTSQVLSPFDQTHVLGTVVSYALPEGWQVRSRFQYATGFPTTAVIGSVFDSSTGSYVSVPGPTLGARTPAFSQLDLRVDKSWRTKAAKITAYVDVRNVYNRTNLVTPYSYSADYDQKYARYGLPVLPMVGARAEF